LSTRREDVRQSTLQQIAAVWLRKDEAEPRMLGGIDRLSPKSCSCNQLTHVVYRLWRVSAKSNSDGRGSKRGGMEVESNHKLRSEVYLCFPRCAECATVSARWAMSSGRRVCGEPSIVSLGNHPKVLCFLLEST
jgi:hypothetical protein